MMATEPISAGEVIVRVPKSFLISDELLIKTYGPTARTLSTQPLLALHLVLLLQQEQDCWWKPYLDLLPTHFNTLPVTFPPVLFDHLPQPLASEVELQRKKIKDDYGAVVRFLKTTGRSATITFKSYEWAWLCVNTRCIHMTTNDKSSKGGNIAMAPFLDFLNHTSEARITSGFNSQTQSFEIKTLTPYRSGEQVFINYGPHDNQAIFREYGFVLPQNEYNFVSLDHQVWQLIEETEQSARNIKIKREILEQTGYEGDYTIKKQDISFRLLCVLRLIALKDVQSFNWAAWHDVIMGLADQIDDTNERMVYHMLQSICTRAYTHAEEKRLALDNLEDTSVHHHPFALYFLRQIWRETCEILKDTLMDIQQQLNTM
ncbi:hypothetical protein BC941DRAFT_229167 [Chlamydoabsidia padenii]|nr:hypothetical protein BC941DRAFT_229167 [Chlamydoabsidia padenii]